MMRAGPWKHQKKICEKKKIASQASTDGHRQFGAGGGKGRHHRPDDSRCDPQPLGKPDGPADEQLTTDPGADNADEECGVIVHGGLCVDRAGAAIDAWR